MKEFIRESLRENFEGKDISVRHLEQILNNVKTQSAIKFLKHWISKGKKTGAEMVFLSAKEISLLKLIKTSGIVPKDFSFDN
jgi:hypothetical protein